MSVDLNTSWCATDLGPYRPCDGTYERYPLDSLPPLPKLVGDLSWLGERGEPDTANMEVLADLAAGLEAVGVTLPEDFVAFYSWTGWSGELDYASVTGCWTRLGPLPLFSPVEPGAFLVRFLSDQQDCATWYLYLRQDQPAFVVHAYELDPDYQSDDPESGMVYRCADSFEEFAYRFWIENLIWQHLHTTDAGPLPPEFADYLAHYPLTELAGDQPE